jgi:predicted peptidase
MIVRRLAILVTTAAALTAAPPATAEGKPSDRPSRGIKSVTAITKVYTFGQKVAAVAIEYSGLVNPRTLDLGTYTVSDSIYNFRFNPIEDLQKRADRTITRVYTNDQPMIDARGSSDRGRYVVVELDPDDPGGNTVIRSKCEARCYEKINPDLLTEVVQNENVYAQDPGHGRGRLLAAGGPARHPLTGESVGILTDDFSHETFLHSGLVVPYAFHIPAGYDPRRKYPLVVVLPGWGSGFDGDNVGVQVAVDITATAWLQPEWTGVDDDVIVLTPQTQRVGTQTESAATVALLKSFMARYSIDPDRVYASAFSWGSTLAYDAMADHPGLFTATLITAGFRVNADQAARIAKAKTPIWITHGANDPVLPVAFGRDSTQQLRSAYVAAGADPAESENLIRYTEYPDNAYSQPDYHAVVGPTYEDTPILRWLLQRGLNGSGPR